MWQDIEGKLDVTIAAVSGVIIVLTLALLLVMERIAGLSRRMA
jgi:putative spermidine/putrescine transport system permease protein